MSRKREYRKRTVPELTMSSKSALFSLSFSLCSHLKKIQSSFFLPLLPHPHLLFHFITTVSLPYEDDKVKKQLAMSRQKIESPPTVIIISSSQHVQQRSEQAGRRVVHSFTNSVMVQWRRRDLLRKIWGEGKDWRRQLRRQLRVDCTVEALTFDRRRMAVSTYSHPTALQCVAAAAASDAAERERARESSPRA